MSAWRWLGCAALICALGACGGDDDKGDDDAAVLGNGKDASMSTDDAGPDADVVMTPPKHRPDAGPSMRHDASVKDAEPDAFNPFDYDASGDYTNPDDFDPGPAPKGWTCSKGLWNDGFCDCGCSVKDVDCTQFSCIQPGCMADTCEACFAANGSWRPCSAPPDSSGWTCDSTQKSDGVCDCGCGIPDPDCLGSGCSEPGCRKPQCDTRTGCEPGTTTDVSDDCTNVNPSVLQNDWKCAWDHYGSGDGCDCGCGALDPDCGGLGCTAARCYTNTCDSCFDENGRPYSCDAAQGGWDDDIVEATLIKDPSMCNGAHFDADDGCDCGCGGIDPDCGDDGCEGPGCHEDACDRCTDLDSRLPGGCAPTDWLAAGCSAANFGTGDGCDCGCEFPDPDCDDDGCTGAGCGTTDDSCDVCWDSPVSSGQPATPVACKGWTCLETKVSDGNCDCGCGTIDPVCRVLNRVSCTKENCETAACQYCDDDGERVLCGGDWSDSVPIKFYGLDGLCDCGAGAPDPDCGKDEGCSEPGCLAEGCDVCYGNNQQSVCFEWTCDDKGFGTDDGCDCGCGAPDPDCEPGKGCVEPGCEAECDTCHDPYGRKVKCP